MLILEAFKQTIEKYQNVDIVVNNAALYNDSNWAREIAVNFVSNNQAHNAILSVFFFWINRMELYMECYSLLGSIFQNTNQARRRSW